MFHQEFKEYWKEVEQFLTCSRASRKKFYSETLEAANRFVEENPGVAFAQVEEYLGSPQELAENYLDTLSQKEITTTKSKKKILMAILVIAFVIAAIVAIALFLNRNQLPVIYVDTVIVDEGDISIPES